METTVEFKKSSLSYFFYKTGFEFESYAISETDICSYRARVAFGVFKVSIIASVVSVILSLVGFAFYSNFALSLGAAVAVCSFIAVLVNWDSIMCWYRNRNVDVTGQEVPRQPGFIRAAYRAHKDKVCYKVTIVE